MFFRQEVLRDLYREVASSQELRVLAVGALRSGVTGFSLYLLLRDRAEGGGARVLAQGEGSIGERKS